MSDETPSGTANVLLEVDGHDDCEEEACMTLSGVDDPSAVDVVFVTFTKSADQRLAAWRDHAHAPPANIGIVSVEMGGADGRSEPDRRGGPAVRRISDPSDLTGVGIAISEFLSAWADTDQQTVVCFDSVTALLQYVDANRVFQFLNEMTSKFEQAGAHAHFHLLPAAHESQDLSVLTSLFGERKTAANVVGAGAAADATADTAADEADDEAVEETASEADEVGFVFNDGEDDEAGETAAADVVEAFPDADDTEDASAETDEDDAEADGSHTDDTDTDDTDTGDQGDTDIDPMEAAFDAVEAAALDDDDESADGSDGPAAPDDETAGAPQDRVESSVKDVEQSEPPEFGSKRSRSRGKGTTSATATGSSTAADDGPNTSPSSTTSADDGGSRYKAATYSRTTATVIGVVTMLVLISFLAAAMPLPVANDAPDAGQDAITTATPSPTENSAVSGTQATETPTPVPTDTPTDTPTPTPTASPTATDTPTDTPTPTSTPEPTATPTETPTPTPDGSLIDDTTDTVDDTVNDTTDTVDDTLSTDDDGLL